MIKKIPALAFWLVLAVAAVAVPIACSSSSTSNDGAPGADTQSEHAPVDMTSSG
jgi:hypothetical protein